VRSGHHVYLVRCSDGAYYCGYALDPVRRVEIHNGGKGAKSLRGRRPVKLVYVRQFFDKGDALRFERDLKRRTHADKDVLARRWSSKRK
jgi:putative endonuclease